jgi:regulator of RNase E activity RraA
MASKSKALGVVGYVVDGSVRDLMGIKKVGVPVWAKGIVPGHGILRLVRVNTSVTVGSLRLHPKEIIVADTDGCTKIPLGHDSEAVLEQAHKVREREAKNMASFSAPSFNYEEWKAAEGG